MSKTELQASLARAPALPRARPAAARWRRLGGRLPLATLAWVLAVLWLAPLVWVALGTLKPQWEVTSADPRWLPQQFTLYNWVHLLHAEGKGVNAPRSFLNSVVVSTLTTITALVICSTSAYAFARLRFWGRDVLFVCLLATLMVPQEAILVPLFLQFHRLGLLNTYASLILPNVVSILGVFLLRQFMLTLPHELEEAAEMDGANVFQIFWYVIVPLVRPALATLGTFVFLFSWNDFLWPLIAISKTEVMTLPLALVSALAGYEAEDFGAALAAIMFAVVPPLVFFAFCQNFIIKGISRTGLKG